MPGKLAALVTLLQQPVIVYVATTLAAFVGFVTSVLLLWKAKLDIAKVRSELRRRNAFDEQLSLQVEKLRLDIAQQKEAAEAKAQIVKVADMVEMRKIIGDANVLHPRDLGSIFMEHDVGLDVVWRSKRPRYLRYLAAFFAFVFAIAIIAVYRIL